MTPCNILIIILLTICLKIYSQDFHHSQIFNANLIQSPSYIGALAFHRILFENRIFYTHRQQWRSIQSTYISNKVPLAFWFWKRYVSDKEKPAL